MKKLAILLASISLLTMSIFALTGCNKEIEYYEGAYGKLPKDVTLNVYSWWDITNDGLLKLKAGFEEKYAEYNVKLELKAKPGTNYASDMLTSIGAGEKGIDVMMLAVDQVPKYAKADALMNLTSLLSDTYKNDIYDVVKDSTTVGGEYYAVARDVATMCMYLNQDIFDKYDIDIPDEDWTMDEFTQLCADLTGGEGQSKTYGFATKLNPADIFTFVNIFGGKYFDPDTHQSLIDGQKTKDALWYMYDMIQKGQFMGQAAMSTYGSQAVNSFDAGAAAMIYGSPSVITSLSDGTKFVVRPIPKNAEGVSKSYAFVNTWTIPKNAEMPEWSVKIAEYFAGSDGQRVVVDNNMGMPASKSLDVTEFLAKNDYNKYFYNAIQDSESYPKGITGSAFQSMFKTSLNEKVWDIAGLNQSDFNALIDEIDGLCQAEMDKVDK